MVFFLNDYNYSLTNNSVKKVIQEVYFFEKGLIYAKNNALDDFEAINPVNRLKKQPYLRRLT